MVSFILQLRKPYNSDKFFMLQLSVLFCYYFVNLLFFYTCRHCSHHSNEDLLDEVILATGYFCVLNPDNQVCGKEYYLLFLLIKELFIRYFFSLDVVLLCYSYFVLFRWITSQLRGYYVNACCVYGVLGLHMTSLVVACNHAFIVFVDVIVDKFNCVFVVVFYL